MNQKDKEKDKLINRVEALIIAITLADELKITLAPRVYGAINAAGALLVEDIRRNMNWSHEQTVMELMAKSRSMKAEYDAERNDPIEALKASFRRAGFEVDAAFIPARDVPDLKAAIMAGNLADVAAALGTPPKPRKPDHDDPSTGTDKGSGGTV